MSINERIVNYIIKLLLGKECADFFQEINYSNKSESKIVIKPSHFFDESIYLSHKSLPTLPLKELYGVPILYGEPVVECSKEQIIVHADLVASTYFLISRYEECVSREVRDEHGRFIGKQSLPFKADFLHRPIVEEYGAILRKIIREAGFDVKEPSREFSHIYLTHDVDQIWTWDNYYRAFRTFAKRVLKNNSEKLQPIKSVYNYKKYDPVFTFPELLRIDNELKGVYGGEKCSDIYFVMGCEKKSSNDIGYFSNQTRHRNLLEMLKENKAEIGIHTSYAASLDMGLFADEVNNIERLSGCKISKVRNHYLASREPEDFGYYIDSGMTDDFTMGYADLVGFRLGTCRPVRWINPIRKELTSLILHPMTVMECTLDDDNYMSIKDEDAAFNQVKGLLDQIMQYNGETVLLWHSPSIYDKKGSYRRKLYLKILEYLKQLKSG